MLYLVYLTSYFISWNALDIAASSTEVKYNEPMNITDRSLCVFIFSSHNYVRQMMDWLNVKR